MDENFIERYKNQGKWIGQIKYLSPSGMKTYDENGNLISFEHPEVAYCCKNRKKLKIVMLEFRPFNLGDFDYILITTQANKIGFLPPQDFDDGFFYSLRTYPKNIIQLNNPGEYFRLMKFTRKEIPIRFSVLYEPDVDAHLKRDFLKDAIKIIFIAKSIKNKREITRKFNEHYSLVFYVFLGEETALKKIGDKICRHASDLFDELTKNSEEIENIVNKVYAKGDFKFKINFESNGGEEFNKPVYFLPAQVNYFTLNQAIGNFWHSYKGDNQDELIAESKKAAASDISDTTRFKSLMDTVDKIDSLEMSYFEVNKAKLPNFYTYKLVPLILISSYNYPHLNDFFEARLKKDKQLKVVLKSLGFEQRLNYTNYFEETEIEKSRKETLKTIKAVGSFQKIKLHYLDGLAYLHAAFKSSPAIRLPFLGNKVKRELSFFRPEVIRGNFKSLKSSIDTFGKRLLESTIPKEFVEKIFTRPRQIVSITDLPIEWLNIDGLPLSLTHDITRMPEHPMSGIMAYNVMNTNFKLSISKDILKDTLVLFCASEEDENYDIFFQFYKKVQELSAELEFKTFVCKSVQEAAELVREHQPNLLIFDCHGYYDSDSLSSYLMINNEKLDGAGIVRNKISAPIVFLSACFTNPTYGYVNGIANAFFEAGSLAVTATYFPISISAGSVLYLRLLKNLKYASSIPVHNNWLEFICHVIRTSYTMNISMEILSRIDSAKIDETLKGELSKQLTDAIAKINTGLMSFEYRFQIVNEFEKIIKEVVQAKIPNFKIDFSSLIPEHLFYTNLGRGDLIIFNCWQEKYYSLNNLTQ